MPDTDQKLTPADASDIANWIAFALRYSGGKHVHDSDVFTSRIAADRIVRHLEQAGFVVLKRPPMEDQRHEIHPRATRKRGAMSK